MDWIFQGNPDTFDVDGYLRDLTKITWTIRQTYYADEIQIGDRVFFWRSKGSTNKQSGIIAIGLILSKPVMMSDNPESVPYRRNNDKSSEALRVWINVTHCMLSKDYVLSKEIISSDPVLSNLTILCQPRTTNYKISEEQGQRLFSLYTSGHDTSIVPVQAFSWTIENNSIARKVLDKSAFLHWGTGIPIAIRSFFIEQEMSPGEKRSVTLLHEGQEYPAHVDLEAISTARTRLFWNSDFSNVIKSSFPYHHKLYSENLEPESSIIIKFERIDGYKKYQVSFAGEVSEDTSKNDIDAEQLNDSGPKKEGGVKEYFGKRGEFKLQVHHVIF
jgi:predicted RNA-binding protein with PUA-like domain